MHRKILHGDEMWWPLLPLRETHKAGNQCIPTCSCSLDTDILCFNAFAALIDHMYRSQLPALNLHAT